MIDVVLLLLKIVLVTTLVVFTRFFIPCLISVSQLLLGKNITTLIRQVVETMEQLFPESGMGAIKKEKALEIGRRLLDRIGIKITDEELDVFIESSVREMKKENKK